MAFPRNNLDILMLFAAASGAILIAGGILGKGPLSQLTASSAVDEVQQPPPFVEKYFIIDNNWADAPLTGLKHIESLKLKLTAKENPPAVNAGIKPLKIKQVTRDPSSHSAEKLLSDTSDDNVAPANAVSKAPPKKTDAKTEKSKISAQPAVKTVTATPGKPKEDTRELEVFPRFWTAPNKPVAPPPAAVLAKVKLDKDLRPVESPVPTAIPEVPKNLNLPPLSAPPPMGKNPIAKDKVANLPMPGMLAKAVTPLPSQPMARISVTSVDAAPPTVPAIVAPPSKSLPSINDIETTRSAASSAVALPSALARDPDRSAPDTKQVDRPPFRITLGSKKVGSSTHKKGNPCNMDYSGAHTARVPAGEGVVVVLFEEDKGSSCLTGASTDKEWAAASVNPTQSLVEIQVAANPSESTRTSKLYAAAGKHVFNVVIQQDGAK